MGAYFRFWKQCFDFKNMTSRKDYRKSLFLFVVFGSLIRFLEILFLEFTFDMPTELASHGPLFTIYGCLGTIALISMSVRRLRDGGYLDQSAWKFLIPILGLIRLMWCLIKEESKQENNFVS